MSTVSSDPAHAKKSRNSRKALKQKNEIVESSPLLSPVSGKGKESKSFEKDLMEMQAMLEKMKIEKDNLATVSIFSFVSPYEEFNFAGWLIKL